MTRYIDADALHDALRKEQRWIVRKDGYVNEGYSYDQVHFAIDKQPTVEAKPVRHGEWIDEGYYADYTNVSAWRCSECGWHMIGYSDELFRYCPSCGAKMKGAEE